MKRVLLALLVLMCAGAGTVDEVTPVVHDTFTDANATDLDEHAIDLDTPGNGWSIVDVWTGASAGFAQVHGNAGIVLNSNTGVVTDIGQSDGVVRVTYTPPVGVDSNVAIVLRYVDAANWHKCQFIEHNNTIRIQRRVAGLTTNFHSQSFQITEGQPYELMCGVVGDRFTFAIDGTDYITFANSSALDSATKFGFSADVITGWQEFDDLSIWPQYDPTLTDISIAGTVMTLASSEALVLGAGGNGGYSLACSGGAVTPAYNSGSGTTTQVYDLSRTVGPSETCDLDHTQPGDGWETAAGYDLPDFVDAAVFTGSFIPVAPCNVGGVTYYYAVGECPASVGAVSVILDGTDVIASATVDRGDGTLGWFASASSESPACEVIIAGTDAIDHSTTAVNAAGQLWDKTLTSITAGDRYIHVGHQRNGRPHCDIETSAMITVPGSPGSADEVDFNPGHYILGRNDRTDFPTAYGQDDIQGAMVLFYWGVVQTGPTTFNWSGVQTALDNLEANGKRGIVFIRDTQFTQGAAGSLCAPSHMFPDQVIQFQAGSGTYKCKPKRWETDAMSENIAMWEDFADNFADHPALEGIILGEESALGLTDAEAVSSGFDRDDYLTELMRRNTEVRAMLPNHVIFQNVNWFQNDATWMEALIAQGASLGIGMTAPDPKPTLANSFYREYNDLVPVSLQGQRLQNPDWEWRYGDPCDPDEVYDAMLNDMLGWFDGSPGWDGMHYFFWPDNKTEAEGCTWTQILSTIATQKALGNDVIQTCPANLTCE